MKSLLMLTLSLLDELGDLVSTCTIRDRITIVDRVDAEGVSFLTITLADFCSDFQKSLDRGHVANTDFQSFKKVRCLPAFLRGFTSLVFDSETGSLLEDPSSEAIFAVRQITLLHSKVSIPCTPERVDKAIRGYLESETKVRQFDARITQQELDDFTRVSNLLFRDTLQEMDELVYYLEERSSSEPLSPKHGPGSTAERIVGNLKWESMIWTQRLEKVFPNRYFVVPNERYALEADADLVEPGAETPVRVITVPKTLKTPRIIALEPVAIQYMQQALMAPLRDKLEADLTASSFVGFTDQTPNQEMARLGSLNGSLATLDLKAASDSVSNQLVRAMLRDFPHFGAAVDATRSRKADVPGHGVVRLAKFASMGSALTFPVEAMVFTTLVFMGIEKGLSEPLSRKQIRRFRGRVRVYGDDLIVPTDDVHAVIDRLTTYGFEVGLDKSFWTGRFRESCGREYFGGDDVSITKCRRVLPTSQQNAEEVISVVSLRNQLYESGLWRTAGWLDENIRQILTDFPIVEPTSPALGRHSKLGYQAERECPELHRPLVRAYVSQGTIPINALDGPSALLKYFLKRGDQPYSDGHLERSGRPDAVKLKRRWTTPF